MRRRDRFVFQAIGENEPALVYWGGAESSAGPESHAVASIASIPDTPIARNSMRSLSGLPMN
jgi:hypothetical protein